MGRQGDTIAAVATPAGPGAIGILRLSGPGAADIAAACFRPLGRKGLLDHPTRTLVYGSLLDCEGQVIDQVLCTYSRGPASYTGEDTAELHCHGSPMVLSLGLEALFAQGARQAGPGEFTQRAFLNGRLDLAQAEGVADLLDARSREGARHAAGQLSGALSRKIAAIYSALVDVMAHFHAVLDYPDEDIDPFTQEQLARDLEAQRQDLEALLSTYQRGRRLSRGVKCAIVGRPNAGKSTLLNLLAGFDRAIVTPVAGTTRDVVEQAVRLGDIRLNLFDTAGLRETEDAIEAEGIRRSWKKLEEAGLILAVFDGSEPLTREDLALAQRCAGRPAIALVNKEDKPTQFDAEIIAGDFAMVIPVCCQEEGSRRVIAAAVARLLGTNNIDPHAASLSGQRQLAAATRARDAVAGALDAVSSGFGLDAVSVCVDDALDALCDLTGENASENVINEVFERFCVGK